MYYAKIEKFINRYLFVGISTNFALNSEIEVNEELVFSTQPYQTYNETKKVNEKSFTFSTDLNYVFLRLFNYEIAVNGGLYYSTPSKYKKYKIVDGYDRYFVPTHYVQVNNYKSYGFTAGICVHTPITSKFSFVTDYKVLFNLNKKDNSSNINNQKTIQMGIRYNL